MLELADRLLGLLGAGERPALATSVDVIGSAPQLAGTSMAVAASGAVIGSVSGGCVETVALEACHRSLTDHVVRVMRFGFGDEVAARSGLACGGELDVLIHRLGGPAVLAELAAAAAGRPAALGVVISGPQAALGGVIAGVEGAGAGGQLDPALLPDGAVPRLRAAVAATALSGRSGPVTVECGPQPVRLFVDVSLPAARMIILGATETAAALAAAAAAVGYAVTVCDHRPALTTPDRFPAARDVVLRRSHEYLIDAELDGRSVVCLLGHDEDLDPLAIAVALERGVHYVGALGSRSTAARRRDRLRALGVVDDEIARLHAPIGLDLGASTPAETAVAILAEVLATRTGGTAIPLVRGVGAIHRPVSRADPRVEGQSTGIGCGRNPTGAGAVPVRPDSHT